MPLPLFIETERGGYLSVAPGTQYNLAHTFGMIDGKNFVQRSALVALVPNVTEPVTLFAFSDIVPEPGNPDKSTANAVKLRAKKLLDTLIAEMARPMRPEEIALKRDFTILRMEQFVRANFATSATKGGSDAIS